MDKFGPVFFPSSTLPSRTDIRQNEQIRILPVLLYSPIRIECSINQNKIQNEMNDNLTSLPLLNSRIET